MTQKVRRNVNFAESWTPYQEVLRYRRLLILSVILNLILAAALLKCLR